MPGAKPGEVWQVDLGMVAKVRALPCHHTPASQR